MFMVLTNSLVLLFIAVLLQIFLRNFYSNAYCLSLLWLYLGNSQVSVYRTIGPTLVEINLFCFDVVIFDIVHDVEAIFHLP